jgi:predicted DNA-binding transcriptional regulator AlpA
MPHWTDFLDLHGPDGAYLPWKKVEPRVGISRTTAWRLQKAGEFPNPYVVSPGRVAYRESEVEAWKASRGHRTAAAAQPADVRPTRTAKTKMAKSPPLEPSSWSPPPPGQGDKPMVKQVDGGDSAAQRRAPKHGSRQRSDSRSGGEQMKFEF